MAVLESYGKEIHSVFQLLGEKENDITLSMSWALCKCQEFLKNVVAKVSGVSINPEEVTVLNQKYDAETGITDIEVTDYDNIYIIFEAKRGWILPCADQLTRYSVREDFVKSPAQKKHIVTLSECTQDYANAYLPFHNVNGIPVSHLAWREVYELAMQAHATSNHEQKHLLAELCEYLGGILCKRKTQIWCM